MYKSRNRGNCIICRPFRHCFLDFFVGKEGFVVCRKCWDSIAARAFMKAEANVIRHVKRCLHGCHEGVIVCEEGAKMFEVMKNLMMRGER